MNIRRFVDIKNEDGQSIVLIAAAFLVLLAFVGLATDVGLAFVRSSEFSKAVDAAAQSAVQEITPEIDPTKSDPCVGYADPSDESELCRAQLRAQQFLTVNGWPTDTLTVFENSLSITRRGIMPQYSLTVTWPVPVFFLRLVGVEGFPITHSATAAYFAQAEIYTPTGGSQGQIKTGTQFILGRDACAKEGDPVSPVQSTPGTPNEDYPFFNGIYKYRIRIPTNYTTTVGNTLRVELFDPDSVNRQFGKRLFFTHSNSVGGNVEDLPCVTIGPGDRCFRRTGESLTAAFQNPLWLHRVDENWDANCDPPTPTGDGEGDTITEFSLYYIDEFGARAQVARYVDDSSNAAFTDMQWVSPCESGLGCDVPTETGSFEIDISTIPLATDDSRSLYLDVSSSGGTAKNSWDLWAGPPFSFYTDQGLAPLERNVNLRNLQIANQPTDYTAEGVSIFALGRMPINQFIDGESITMRLATIDNDFASQSIFGTLFDYDKIVGGANSLYPPPDLKFTYDTVSDEAAGDPPDYSLAFNVCSQVLDNPTPNHSGFCFEFNYDPYQTSCDDSQNCDNQWMMPQINIPVPQNFIFPGGALQVTYEPNGDSHVWELAVSAGNPFLTK